MPGFVDRGAFDRSALMLANHLLRVDPGAPVEGPPPAVAITDGTIEADARGPCVALVPGARGARATWTLSGTRFGFRAQRLQGPLRITAGVLEAPSGRLAGVPTPSVATQAVVARLPALPGGLHWSLGVELEAGDRIEVCNAGG